MDLNHQYLHNDVAHLNPGTLNRYISWVVCGVLHDCLPQQSLLFSQVGRDLIINISEKLSNWWFWHSFCNLNGLKKL